LDALQKKNESPVFMKIAKRSSKVIQEIRWHNKRNDPSPVSPHAPKPSGFPAANVPKDGTTSGVQNAENRCPLVLTASIVILKALRHLFLFGRCLWGYPGYP
jgi:hypothetical protein